MMLSRASTVRHGHQIIRGHLRHSQLGSHPSILMCMYVPVTAHLQSCLPCTQLLRADIQQGGCFLAEDPAAAVVRQVCSTLTAQPPAWAPHYKRAAKISDGGYDNGIDCYPAGAYGDRKAAMQCEQHIEQMQGEQRKRQEGWLWYTAALN